MVVSTAAATPLFTPLEAATATPSHLLAALPNPPPTLCDKLGPFPSFPAADA